MIYVQARKHRDGFQYDLWTVPGLIEIPKWTHIYFINIPYLVRLNRALSRRKLLGWLQERNCHGVITRREHISSTDPVPPLKVYCNMGVQNTLGLLFISVFTISC